MKQQTQIMIAKRSARRSNKPFVTRVATTSRTSSAGAALTARAREAALSAVSPVAGWSSRASSTAGASVISGIRGDGCDPEDVSCET